MTPASLSWIIVHPNEESNWWLRETSEGPCRTGEARGILDSRQIADLLARLEEYRSYGLSRNLIEGAFHRFVAVSELSDGSLRLTPAALGFLDADPALYALPNVGEEGDGPYCDFLEALSAARIRRLNATHRYARACTEQDMFEELDALDRDRYFGASTIHPSEEINEILQWSPAEWDER